MVNNPPNPAKDSSQEKVAISRAEIFLLIMLVVVGMSTSVWVERKVHILLSDQEPREGLTKARFRVPSLQAEVLMAEKERKAIESQLIDARLEQGKQSATTGALVAEFPELTRPPAADSKTSAIPADTAQAYRDAHIKELAAERLVRSLTERLEVVRNHATQSTAALEQSQYSARTEFLQSHALYQLGKRVLTFTLSLLIVLVLILIVRWFTAPGRRFAVRRRLTFPLALGVLFILFGYQSFELAGAALVGVVVLLILFTNYLPWPAKATPAATQSTNETTQKK